MKEVRDKIFSKTKAKQIEVLKSKIRYIDTVNGFLALFIIVLYIIECETYINRSLESSLGKEYESTPFGDILRCIIIISSLSTCMVVVC